MKRPLILIGFKACGKTSVGRALAQKIQTPFMDTDQLLEAQYAKETGQALDCPAIFREVGEQAFRALEKQVVASLATTGPAVIATGGGVVLEPENMRVLRRLGTVIYLSASYETLLHRLQARALPAYLDDLETGFQKIFQHRQSLYRKLSDRILDVDQVSVVEISEQLYQIYKDK